MKDITGSTIPKKLESNANFFSLPRDIREKIYGQVMEDEASVTDPLEVLRFNSKVPTICYVNKQIKKESLHIALSMRMKTIAETIGSQAAPYEGLGGVEEGSFEVARKR